ncbi:hypothetical protein KQI21_13855 [Virgibacillus proomii]|uniref:DUF7168 domain-containing protein n=1 Tax=Virgibacillus proomii TaxID=84407 RepID=UPI001C1074D4|nr:hypothetical protein [Virgibacillus proomii]MBU5267877.1 hypothetical protein [Virgibacillus proomii]
MAYEVITFYTKEYVETYYSNNNIFRSKQVTSTVKNSYMKGFLTGLQQKFEEQINEMRQENALMVLVPVEVQEKYDEMFEGTKPLLHHIPTVKEYTAYTQGYEDGSKIDYTKSTIEK